MHSCVGCSLAGGVLAAVGGGLNSSNRMET